jgi:OmpA-OmpF porin, OOP family
MRIFALIAKSSLMAAFGLFCLIGKSQTNLVPNPSFEQYSICPHTGLGLHAIGPDIWYKPDWGGAGYFNSCAGNSWAGVPYNYALYGSFQFARTGNGYIGMFYKNSPKTNARNYFQVQMLDSLKKSKHYYAEYYISLTNDSRLGCNNQGVLFTKQPVYVDTNAVPLTEILPAFPQVLNKSIIIDTQNWVKVAGIFTAKGGEQFLTLGNFFYDSVTVSSVIQTAGYYGAIYYR